MIELETSTSEVTVFRDGARVTRVGRTKLNAGEHEILVMGLSEFTDEDSVRVTGLGSAELVNISVEKIVETVQDEKRLKKLRDELRKLERKRNKLQDKIKRLRSSAAALIKLTQSVSIEVGHRITQGETEADMIAKTGEPILSMITSMQTDIREAEDELKDVEDQIAVVQNNIEIAGGSHAFNRFTNVQITLAVKEPTELELGVVYQVNNASWNPQYDVDLREDGTMIKRMAMVINNTKEDWEDVKLTVSTASARPAQIIEPTPYYVGEYYIPPPAPAPRMARAKKVMREPEMPLAMAEPEEEAPFDELMEEAEETFAEVGHATGGIVTYHVPGKTSIRSDKDPRPVTLVEEEFESKRYYYWNAYAMPTPVALEKVTNGDSVLLPGMAKIYADGEYIGESAIELIAPREEFKLGTREAFDVRVEKKLLIKDTDRAGLRGKNKREYQYDLVIKSFAKKDIEMEIVDRIPYSSSEKIKVELQDPSIRPESFKVGVLEWKLSLAAGSETHIKYGYVVEWERDVNPYPPLP